MDSFKEGNHHTVEFIHGVSLETMPSEVVEQAKICLLDLIGACLAGRHAKGAAILMSLAQEQFSGVQEATIIGAGRKTSRVSAALVNGFIANALDIDDGHRLCKGHPGSVIFPAILSQAEKSEASGLAFLEALVIGYEVAIRTGMIMQEHYGYFHGSGAWGAVGAAASCSRLLDLNYEQTWNALGIAESYAPLAPVMRSVASPAMAPKDGVTWGAMAGISAALLAGRDYTGSPSLLGDPEHNADVFSMGRVWRIMHIYFKPFPCCRWAQPSVDAVLDLLRASNINFREIIRIIIHTFAESAALSMEIPCDLESAEYNMRYPVAVAAVHGEFTPAYLDKAYYQEEAVCKIFELIEIRVDQDIQEQFPEKCQSRVEIHTQDGSVYDSGLMPARGDWNESPLSRDELETKFLNITKGIIEHDAAMNLIELVRDFENRQTNDLIPYLA